MEWGFLTALGGVQVFPAYGLLAFVAFLLFTGKLMPSSAAVREIERAQENADREAERIAADRDARLEAKNDEIARLIESHNADTARLLEEVKQWRDAWQGALDIASEVRTQNGKLIDALFFVRKVFGALPTASDVEGGDET